MIRRVYRLFPHVSTVFAIPGSPATLGISLFLFLTLTWHSGESAGVADQILPAVVTAPTASSAAEADLRRFVEYQSAPLPGVRVDWPALRAFYATVGYQPVWHIGQSVLPGAYAAVSLLSSAGNDGLYPGEYHLQEIEARLNMADGAALQSLEVMLTDGILKYIRDVRQGRLDPLTADPKWHIHPPEINAPEVLHAALETGSIHSAPGSLPPAHRGYRRLVELLQSYRALERIGGWPMFPDGPKLERGDYGRRVQTLRHRLMFSGDLEEFDYRDPFEFDAALDHAVRRFQVRHGLKTDGVVGRKTLAALNVTVEERIQQILLSMERWRWLPEDLGGRYLMVNMAGFELQVVEDDETVMDMRVIIGRPYRSTPAFIGKLGYLVFNPYWNVPYKLAVRDILPQQQADPGYLKNKGFRVFADWSDDAPELDPATIDWSQYNRRNFPFRLRQDPGEQNSLGRIKFMLPNAYAVYLHDTPSRHLFERPVRTFSSGCIRVEKPVPLAVSLLRGDHPWTAEDVLEAIDSRRNRDVSLPGKLPVYMVYLTAWVDDAGEAHFRDDVYRRDVQMRQAWLAEAG